MIPAADENSPCRISVAPRLGYQQLPAVPVSTRQTGTESWSYSFSSQQPGVLVWTQAYDPLWRLTGAAGSTQFPELSLLNGYLVGPGKHSGTIAFAGESSAIAGVLISLLTGLALASDFGARYGFPPEPRRQTIAQQVAASQCEPRRSQRGPIPSSPCVSPGPPGGPEMPLTCRVAARPVLPLPGQSGRRAWPEGAAYACEWC